VEDEMSPGPLRDLIPQLRQAVLRGEEIGADDGDLLEAFINCRDLAALEVLVRRHAPMVWGVCRRVLAGHQDAEDTFQATFLVLVRKAASVRPRGMVGNWLYGVAHRTALKARATAAKKKAREEAMAEIPETRPEGDGPWAALLPALDRELSRLPGKNRSVIVLCDLEGKTRKEAARHVGLPEGTVASRLARARGMLASRLARCGAVPSAGALAALLAQGVASACPPPLLTASALKSACLVAAGKAAAGSVPAQVAGLSERVVRGMLLNKVLQVTAVLLLVGVATGTGVVVSQRGEKREQDDKSNPPAKAPAPAAGRVAGLPNNGAANKDAPVEKENPAQKELDKLKGDWVCVGYETAGVERVGKEARTVQFFEELSFVVQNATGGRVSAQWKLGNVSSGGAADFQLHPRTTPKGIDVRWVGGGIWGKGALPRDVGKIQPCVYSVEGDRLRICWGEVGSKVRPTGVKTKAGDGLTVVLYKKNTTGFGIGDRAIGR
jgi:RNA polymerase sigma factor (sigma-70 family)